MVQPNEQGVPEQIRSGYSDEEVHGIYELGRIFMEIGNLKSAQTVIEGVTAVAPTYAPAWLAMCYLHVVDKNPEAALTAARKAHDLDRESVEALLFLISCLLTGGDFQSAGTYLGEVSERIESGAVTNPYQVRFFRAQLARYQSR